ncbi:MAG: phosphoglycerate dehydrogenase-like enzyme [Mariniblastus sp.]|jgi:phosphoglycerate dehydrogenase-like enzyme
MSSKTIVTCFPLADSHVERIRTVAQDDFEVIVATQDSIAKDIFQADVFCGHAKVPVDWPKVVAAQKLAWIQSSAAGLDHCLTPSVIDSEIVVSGCSGLFAPQVAEQMLSLLMGLVRRSPVFFRAQQNREYIRRPTDDLFGKTVAIVGLGGNGQRIASVLRPLAKTIIGSDCFPEACQQLIENKTLRQVFAANDWEKMLPEADVVIVTLPLSSANEQLIGIEQFKQFKPGAYLINVGRGSVVETSALVEYLANGHLGGAGIDVVDPEPLPIDSRLWALDNVIISPHVGAQSPLRIPVTIDLFCGNIERFRNGQSLLNQVDKRMGFPRPEHRIQFEWQAN